MRRVAHRLYLSALWLLFALGLGVVLWVGFAEIHDASIVRKATECVNRSAHGWIVRTASWDTPLTEEEKKAAQAARPPKPAFDPSKPFKKVAKAETPLEAALRDLKEEEKRQRLERGETESEAEVALQEDCSITVVKHGKLGKWYANGSLVDSAPAANRWGEFALSFLAFVPLVVVALVHRWIKWLLKDAPAPS